MHHYAANQCTSVWNQVSTFLSLVNKDLPVKNIVFTTNIHYLWKGTLSLKGYRSRRCNFVKVYTSLWGIHCIKNQEVEYLQNKSDLAILNKSRRVNIGPWVNFIKKKKQQRLHLIQSYKIKTILTYVNTFALPSIIPFHTALIDWFEVKAGRQILFVSVLYLATLVFLSFHLGYPMCFSLFPFWSLMYINRHLTINW